MKVLQVLGHNAVVVRCSDGKIGVAIGSGIGFKKQKGDRIQVSIVQKLFVEEMEALVEEKKLNKGSYSMKSMEA